MGIADIIHSLSDNPYFGAGFGLFGVGAAAAIGKKGAQVGFILFRRHYMTTVEVTCKDKSYAWLLQWISARGAQDTQHLRQLRKELKIASNFRNLSNLFFVSFFGNVDDAKCGYVIRGIRFGKGFDKV